jgi:anti-anti-sigma factor
MDAVTVQEFEKSVSELLSGGENVLLVNFSELEYISSAGLRSILATAKQLKARNGEIRFTGLKNTVKEVFEISGFYSIFKTFETEEEALTQR